MVSALVPGASGPGSSPRRGDTVTVPLSTQENKWVPTYCWEKPNKWPGSDLRWTSIPSSGTRNTPSRFILQKPGMLEQITVCADILAGNTS